MKKLFTLILSALTAVSFASIGDTITVQAHDHVDLTWYGNYDDVVAFPAAASFEKITMDFTMGCASGGCSHWDYTVSVFLMNPTGIMDSSIVSLDTLSVEPLEVDTTWNVYEVLEKFELGRLITPYGNYMDWDQPTDPNDIFDENWERSYVFDLTDYASLLQDSALLRVHYGGWSSGFSATVNFDFIEGTPPREVLSLENMYPVGSYSYYSLVEDVHSPPFTKLIPEDAYGLAVKSIISGHAHEGPANCCEWVSKQHHISINDEQIFEWDVWKDCGMNPLFPQGGTWPFDRAGWCPGMKTDLYTAELTEFVELGEEVTLDYGLQPYSGNGEDAGLFIVSNTLFTYGEINFEYDIELTDIIKPTKKDAWSKMNPICANPVIEIRNRGSEFLTSASIQYGLEGGEMSIYEWSGGLDFMESTWVELPTPNWTGAQEDANFVVNISIDGEQYPSNNSMKSKVEIPEVLPSEFVLEFKTQQNFQSTNRAVHNSYEIYNASGDIVYQRDNDLAPNTWYKDTFQLNWGCYEFIFHDSAEDGMNEYWYYGESAGNAGKIRFRNMEGSIFKSFPDDFGQQLEMRFTVDYPLTTQEIGQDYFELYPNPVDDLLTVNISLASENDLELLIFNQTGSVVYHESWAEFTSHTEQIDLRHLPAGMYFCRIRGKGYDKIKKFILLTSGY